MDTSLHPPVPSSFRGWLVWPLRKVVARLNRPVHERLARQTAAVRAELAALAATLAGVQQVADYARAHADNVLGVARDAHTRADALQTHADNVLGVARDAHTRADALQTHADHILDLTRSAMSQADAARAHVAAQLPPHAVSPLTAQALAIDNLALTRRLAMLEDLLVALQAEVRGAAPVLHLPPTALRQAG